MSPACRFKKRPAYAGKREEKDWDCYKKAFQLFAKVKCPFPVTAVILFQHKSITHLQNPNKKAVL